MTRREPDLSRLAEVLRSRRAGAGWTLEELAHRSGLTRQTLMNIEHGRVEGELRTWMKLSQAFGVGLDDLLAAAWVDGDD